MRNVDNKRERYDGVSISHSDGMLLGGYCTAYMLEPNKILISFVLRLESSGRYSIPYHGILTAISRYIQRSLKSKLNRIMRSVIWQSDIATPHTSTQYLRPLCLTPPPPWRRQRPGREKKKGRQWRKTSHHSSIIYVLTPTATSPAPSSTSSFSSRSLLSEPHSP